MPEPIRYEDSLLSDKQYAQVTGDYSSTGAITNSGAGVYSLYAKYMAGLKAAESRQRDVTTNPFYYDPSQDYSRRGGRTQSPGTSPVQVKGPTWGDALGQMAGSLRNWGNRNQVRNDAIKMNERWGTPDRVPKFDVSKTPGVADSVLGGLNNGPVAKYSTGYPNNNPLASPNSTTPGTRAVPGGTLQSGMAANNKGALGLTSTPGRTLGIGKTPVGPLGNTLGHGQLTKMDGGFTLPNNETDNPYFAQAVAETVRNGLPPGGEYGVSAIVEQKLSDLAKENAQKWYDASIDKITGEPIQGGFADWQRALQEAYNRGGYEGAAEWVAKYPPPDSVPDAKYFDWDDFVINTVQWPAPVGMQEVQDTGVAAGTEGGFPWWNSYGGWGGGGGGGKPYTQYNGLVNWRI